MILRSLLAALAGCLALSAAIAAPADTAREQLDSYLQGFAELESDFRQQLMDEEGRLIEESAGRLYLQRPDRFRWDYLEPFEQSIISDGSHIYIYDKDLEQVTVKSVDEALGQTPAALLSGQAAVDENFEVVELPDGQDLRWLGLRPLNAEQDYEMIHLGFDGDGLRAMRLTDNLGQITLIVFSNEQRDTGLQASLFEFSPPAGVDVIRAEP